ncbi:hypothetical protein FAM09_24870 [Niastella caeni]|uniref:Uncharacterized protein n=1 Tax=Niastella caeni TaxID=2569763 RepID=A0A4S8HH43_9BACT|nr:hypothetical protein [Niastella caeni]THU34255.1 hypothetical protein FAM09_24870 [Niastella caeni]
MIGIQRRPYTINLAGNSILYQLYDSEAVADNSYTFEVKVLFARYEEAAAPVEIAIIPLAPYKGVAFIDLADLLNSQLNFYTPDPATAGAQSTGLHSGKFFIHYRRVSTTNTNTPWNTSEEQSVCNIVKGGVHPYMWKGNNFFINYFPTNKPFLTWQQRGRLASLTEPLWLTWLNTDVAGNVALTVKIQLTYTDATQTTTQYNIAQPLKQFFVYFLPAGVLQLGLQALQANKTIWYWDVWVTNVNDELLTEKYRFQHDQRNDYNQKFLLYRNSLGGLDTVRIRGVIETNIALDGQDIEMTAAADWPFTNTLPRFDASTPHRELPAYKGDAGYITREEQERLRDAFLNREVYMAQGSRLLPVKLLTKQYRLRATTDKLFSLPIEWMLADAGSYYYTPGVSLGDGQNNFIDLNNVDLGDGQSNEVCEIIMLLGAATTTYSGANATVNFFYQVPTGTPKKLQYKIPGFITNWTDLTYQPSGILSYTVLAGQSITLYMRTVCQNDGYGPVVMKTVNTTTAGQDANSTVRNHTDIPFSYILTRNGALIAQGSIGPGVYDPIFVPGGTASYDLELIGIVPSNAILSIGFNEHAGNITGQHVLWNNITSNAFAGMIISIF